MAVCRDGSVSLSYAIAQVLDAAEEWRVTTTLFAKIAGMMEVVNVE